MGVIDHVAICPIAFNAFEELKTKLGRTRGGKKRQCYSHHYLSTVPFVDFRPFRKAGSVGSTHGGLYPRANLGGDGSVNQILCGYVVSVLFKRKHRLTHNDSVNAYVHLVCSSAQRRGSEVVDVLASARVNREV